MSMIVLGANAGTLQSNNKIYTPGSGERWTREYSGPGPAVEALYESAKDDAEAPTRFESLDFTNRNGRGTLVVRYAQSGRTVGDVSAGDAGRTDIIEEVYALDVIRPVELHPIFRQASPGLTAGDKVLTNVQMRRVLEMVESGRPIVAADVSTWVDSQRYLYNMLTRGMTDYIATEYVLRQSIIGARASVAHFSFAGIGKVVNGTDPESVVATIALSSDMLNLLRQLPTTGEWLKRPTTVETLGKGRYRVSLEYQWSEAWHAIYGGKTDFGVTIE